MRYSGIGGQAVMEGVMMKNQEHYAVAVRKPDGEIVVETAEYSGLNINKKIKNIPVLRGVFNFIEALALGMRTLMFSASFFEEETENGEKKAASGGENGTADRDGKEERGSQTEQEKKKHEDAVIGGTVAVSVILAVAVFMILPYMISTLFARFVTSQMLLAVIEGVIRLAVFVGYVGVISLMPDIRRVYMYHGAEHKCINCIERGMELTVENVRESSKEHKRCGTSFLLIVMLVSIVFFMFLRVDNGVLRLLLRVLLIPFIAGVAYEFIRLAGRSDNAVVHFLSRPGMWLQRLTTREPEDAMIEVGIASVEAVFDWRSYIKEIRGEGHEAV
mgnify:CR=1 FL=1